MSDDKSVDIQTARDLGEIKGVLKGIDSKVDGIHDHIKTVDKDHKQTKSDLSNVKSTAAATDRHVKLQWGLLGAIFIALVGLFIKQT